MSGSAGSGVGWDTTVSGPMDSQPPADPSASGERVPAPTAPEASPAPRYTREGLLGRGGMGVVYLARDHHLDRLVALKEAARGGQVAERLAREARVTAGLDHPGIVTVHDSGHTEDGRPFYTMRLLRGRPLSLVLSERASWAERTSLVRHYLDACHAVASAHAEGVVHRDLKPANLMVGGFGETQVVDWGLAARLGDPTAAAGSEAPVGADGRTTQTGTILGTPAYMAPEQARGEPVDPRADVWSLGAVLFELLTGRPVREGSAPALVLDAARRGAVPSLRGRPELPPELVAIAERALAADPADRYPDAGALAADVEAFVDGRRVGAHAYTSWELLSRLLRRWRAPLSVGGAAALVVLGVLVVGAVRLARERDRVVAAERETRSALEASDQSLARALASQALTLRGQGSNAAAAVLASRAVRLADLPEAWGLLAGLAAEPRAERLEEEPIAPCSRVLLRGMDDYVCVDAEGVSRRVAGAESWRWSGRVARLWDEGAALWVADAATERGVRIDSTTGEATVGPGTLGPGTAAGGGTPTDLWPLDARFWSPPAGEQPALWIAARLCREAAAQAVAVRPDGKGYGVLCADGAFGAAPLGTFPERYWPTSATRDALSGAAAAAWSPDGRWFMVGGTKGTVVVVDGETGQLTSAPTLPGGAWRLAGSRDGTFVALSGDLGDVDVRTLPDLRPLVRVPVTSVRATRFLADGTLLVAGADTLSRWRLPTAPRSATVSGSDGVTAATWSPDGRYVATAHGQRDALLWEAATGALVARLDIGRLTAKSTVFSPDSRTAWFGLVATERGVRPRALGVDGRTSEVPMEVARVLHPAGGGDLTLRRIGMTAGGTLVGVPYIAGDLFAYDPVGGEGLGSLGCPPGPWGDLGQDPGGEHLVLVGEDDLVQTLVAGPPLRCGPSFRLPGVGAIDVDGAGGLAAATDRSVVRLDASGAVRWRVDDLPEVKDVAVSADGRWVAAGSTDHRARLWDDTGKLRAVFEGHGERVVSVDFRADGEMLATGSWDGTARLWDLRVLGADVTALDAGAPAAWGLRFAEALAAAGE